MLDAKVGRRSKVKTPPRRRLSGEEGASLTQQSEPLLHDELRKPRDIFPLPLLKTGAVPLSVGGRKGYRKLLHARHVEDEVNHTIGSLNSMFGAQPEGAPFSLDDFCHGAAAAQVDSLNHIQCMVENMGKPPADLTGPGAVQMLRTASGYAEDQPTGSLASFDIEAVSLPEKGWEPVSLSSLWGCNGREQMNDFITSQLLPPNESGVKLKASGVVRPYSDPLLRQGRLYHEFLKKLHGAGLIDFSTDAGLEKIAFFCVTKKNKKLRLIVDARRANCHFREPDHVQLTTGEGLGGLEFPAGQHVTIATADLKDAFYHLSLPVELRPYFSLNPVSASSVGITQVNGITVGPKCKITPRLAVVPMGWTWALFLCQSVHEALAEKAGLGEKNRIRDRHVPPKTDCCHTQYVDNMIVLGTDKDSVLNSYDNAVDCLKQAGLQVHDEEVGEGATILGWEITKDCQFQPSRHRAWKVRFAIRELLRRGRCTSHMMEKLIGHCSFLALGRRECFSVFGNVYAFIQKYKSCSFEVSIWKSVRKELHIFDGILPLIHRDLTAEWSNNIYAVDASEHGMGATIASCPLSMVQQLGRVNERWRFKGGHGGNHREQVLNEQFNEVGWSQHNFESDMKPDETFVEHDRKFHNVPFGAVDRDWKTVGMKFWKKRETLPVYEARSSLYAVKHILRKRDNFGKRHLILSDSLTATCAISRGRAQGFTLRRVCSQIGALVLSSGISICIRWIPSEWNPSDNPSRGHWSPSIPKRFFGDGSLQGEHPSGAAAMDWEANGKEDTAEIEGKFIKGIPDLSSCAEYPTRGVVDCKHENKCQKPKDLASSESEECDHPDSQTDDLSGSCIGVKAVTLSLYKLLGMDETGVAEQKAEAEASAYGRQAAEREAGSAFPRWGGHQHGSIPGGCHSVFQPQFEVAEHERLTKSAAVPQGLEEGCASTEPSSCPLGSDVPLGRDGAFKPTLQHCNPSPAYVHFVSSTLGGFADSCMRCDSAFKGPGGCLQAMGFCVASRGGRYPIKDSGFRRDTSTRSGISQGHRGGHQSIHDQEPHSWKPGDSKPYQLRCEPVSGGTVDCPEPSETGAHACLQIPSWRSVSRLCKQVSTAGVSATEGQVEEHELHPPISKRRPLGTDLSGPSKRRAAKMRRRNRRNSGNTAKGALSIAASLVIPVFLEIFSGCGLLGRTISKANNWPTLLWDITLGEEYDLLRICNRQKIFGWMRAGLVRAGHLGTPCNTFSRARDNPPGPPPLRSDTHVLGLPTLQGADLQKVVEGNFLMRFTAAVMRLAILLHIPFTLENPARSRLWLCPPFCGCCVVVVHSSLFLRCVCLVPAGEKLPVCYPHIYVLTFYSSFDVWVPNAVCADALSRSTFSSAV